MDGFGLAPAASSSTTPAFLRTIGSALRVKAREMIDGENEDRATAARLAKRLLESASKQGVYHILRFPTDWRLYAFPWEDFGDLWHGDVWRRFAADDLAEAWKVPADQPKPR